MKPRYLLLNIFIVIVISCSPKFMITADKNECILIKEENRIQGSDLTAKTFGSEFEYYLPRVIESLAFNSTPNSPINSNYSEPPRTYFEEDTVSGGIRVISNPKNKSKIRAFYIIEGCIDTIWAKNRMAEHLMQKYKLTRIDSFYLNDAFTYSIHPDSLHLLTVHNDPNVDLAFKNIGWDFHCMGCTIANSLGWIFYEQGIDPLGFIRVELNPDINYYDQDFLKNVKLHFVYNYNKYREIESSQLQYALREDFGIILTHERRDTVRMGYYVLDE
ncbi:MAG: hypothetical protein P1U56_04785 [Saprospiraceae bacterium]|nr:hypothetical protein [Saprospiraceae bacterium]